MQAKEVLNFLVCTVKAHVHGAPLPRLLGGEATACSTRRPRHRRVVTRVVSLPDTAHAPRLFESCHRSVRSRGERPSTGASTAIVSPGGARTVSDKRSPSATPPRRRLVVHVGLGPALARGAGTPTRTPAPRLRSPRAVSHRYVHAPAARSAHSEFRSDGSCPRSLTGSSRDRHP
jgi:hypothetical protein